MMKQILLDILEEDDFIVVTRLPDTMSIISNGIINEFDRRIQELYHAEDLERGYITTLNRQGVEVNYPIMTISSCNCERMTAGY